MNAENFVLAVDTLTNIKLIGTDVLFIMINIVVPIMGARYVMKVWHQTDSPLKTGVALVAAGAIWWGVANMTILRDQAGETWNRDGTEATSVVITPGVGGGEDR